MKRNLFSVLLAALWISISEFVRNEFLLKTYWIEHYQKMGLTFPSEPLNGAIWGIWSLCFAIFIYIITKQFTMLQTTGIAWFAGFVLMWLVVGNLGVLPLNILTFAIPLSLLETLIAILIIKKTIK